MPSKIDFKKSLKALYGPSPKEISIVNVPEMKFIMIDGMGSPGDSKEYQDALSVLYPVSYKIKFSSKRNGKDYVVPPLEGLWWADDMDDFTKGNRERWKWTMMMMVPEWIDKDKFVDVLEITKEKKPELNPMLPKLRFEKFKEGKAAQILYIGPYSEEGPVIKKLHRFISQHDGKFDGHNKKHHEIYLGDPRRAKPENLRTIIRQPFIK